MLKVHPKEDSKYDINWVVSNHKNVMVDRSYVERHEPTYSGFSIIVQSPDDPEWLMEYGHNEDGFLSVSDFTRQGRVFENMHIDLAIQFIQANTANVLKESKANK